jgi:hypothetical protein
MVVMIRVCDRSRVCVSKHGRATSVKRNVMTIFVGTSWQGAE